MFKKSCLATFLVVLSTSALATTHGFYFGAGAGPDYATINANSHIRQVNPTNGLVAFNVQNNVELAATGLFGTFFSGYGSPLNYRDLYLAAEINGNLSNSQFEGLNNEFIHNNLTTTRIKLYNSYGISVLPGFIFSDTTLFYVRLGYANTSFKIKTNDVSIGSINRNLGGFRWGLGIQQAVANHFALRMEYSNANYNNARTRTLDTLSNTLKTTKFTPYTNTVEFSVLYSFC